MKSRIIVLFVFFVSLWTLLAVRSALLQIVPNEKLAQLQKRQFETHVKLTSRRGAIYDRHGNELAVSVASYSLYADPQQIKSKRKVARTLSAYIHLNYPDIYKKIKSKRRRFVWLQRRMNDQDKEKIQKLKIHGIGFIEEPKRIYPNGELLSQVIGFTGAGGHGLEGIELLYNKKLKSTSKKVPVARDARGRPLIASGQFFSRIPDGQDTYLTIDSQIQYMLEKELSETVEKFDADSAVGVVLDANTSEVIAMANVPVFDLNMANRYSQKLRRNRSVTDAVEPGSTMKTFVVASALKHETAMPSTKFHCENGSLKIGPSTIREADSKHKWGLLTVGEILQHSSNIGTSKIAFGLGDKNFYQTLTEFGFGQKSKVDLPGESKGILHPPPWRKIKQATISYGHGMTATPLQIANGYAAIANGGVLHRPRIVNYIKSDGNERLYPEIPKGKRILSKEVAATLSLMLVAATSKEGTGYNAQIRGFPVAGKTGTAQLVDHEKGGYKTKAYFSSFAGFVPAHSPKYVIYIGVTNPKEKYYGSQVAAPVFSKIAAYSVRKAGLSPILISKDHLMTPNTEKVKIPEMKREQEKAISKLKNLISKTAAGQTPDLKGLSLREVLNLTRDSDISVNIFGNGYIERTQPKAGDPLPESKKISIYLSNESRNQ